MKLHLLDHCSVSSYLLILVVNLLFFSISVFFHEHQQFRWNTRTMFDSSLPLWSNYEHWDVNLMVTLKDSTAWKASVLYFPAFELNTERYIVSLRSQSKCGEIRTRKTPNTDTFHAVQEVCLATCQTSINELFTRMANRF